MTVKLSAQSISEIPLSYGSMPALAKNWMLPRQTRLGPISNENNPKIRESRKSIGDRKLYSNDDFESLLVDGKGEALEPYSLAWRYLGMYIDCDNDYADEGNNGQERRLSSDDSCERVLLWAAYVDPKYKGGGIGEYQFYDLSTMEWDKSSCKTSRCARMDCHEDSTHFKLVGVFKESDGLDDWAEQLFKHHGYCIWDEDTYEFMQEYRERWPTYCIKLYFPDADGNKIYLNMKPLGEGNVTMGIYTDEDCLQNSSYTLSDYIMVYYSYYGNYEKGQEVAATWEEAISDWNAYMNVYKICQPCRAYNLYKTNDHNEPEKNGRLLKNDENDGEGDEEPSGYNCYDDAGYTNCNQCYKFETKTDMEAASVDDLERASAQGTILRIKVNGKVYGQGGFSSPRETSREFTILATILAAGMVTGALIFLAWKQFHKRRLLRLPAPLQENFKVNSEEAAMT